MPEQTSGQNPEDEQKPLVQGEFDFEAAELAANGETAPVAETESQATPDTPPSEVDPAAEINQETGLVREALLGSPIPDIIDPDTFQRVLHSDQLYTQVDVHQNPEFKSRMMPTIEKLSRLRAGVAHSTRYTDVNERHELDTLIRLAKNLPPAAVLLNTQTQHNQTIKPSDDRDFANRLFLSGNRSVLPAVQQAFLKDGNPISIQAFGRQQKGEGRVADIPGKLADGTIDAAIHPKEHALREFIAHSPHLESGGTVLVICEDKYAAKYLTKKAVSWERVQSATRGFERTPAGQAGVKELLASESTAFAPEGDGINVIILKPSQLLRKEHPGSSVHASLTVVVDAGYSVRKEKLLLETDTVRSDKRVNIQTNQVIDLTTPDKPARNLQRLLNLRGRMTEDQEIDDKDLPWWFK